MKKRVDVSIPLGPMHPILKEPCRIKCETRGERVVSVELELGYMKKGIERIMKGRPWQEVMFLAERVCGICSVIHNMVFIEAMEKISSIEVPKRAAYLRVIVNELDRIQSHLIANFSYCYTIEHETIAMYLLNTRETVMDLLEMITGARVTCSYMIPGGVRFDIVPEDHAVIHAGIDSLEKEITRYAGMFESGPLIKLRSVGVGILTPDDALLAHAVGPTARASSIAYDARSDHPTYRDLEFNLVTRSGCDNHSRIMLRFDEIFQSIALIRKALATLPEGLIRGGGVCTAGSVVYSGEAPRGELTYQITSDEYGRIIDIAIQTPSIMNEEACVHFMMTDVTSIADVSSSFISCDPCIACTER
ncbi:MAG: nickel-dependent hydrogenase large subunit [Methanospirillaceae archaeon]|nr:nickel-dependent hydrogenase large subunit [Methanospirillaceae archaeon]